VPVSLAKTPAKNGNRPMTHNFSSFLLPWEGKRK
jgi:hypothetical protein